MAFYPVFIPTHALFEEKAGKQDFFQSQSVKLRRHLSCQLGVLKQFLCSSRLASTFGKSLNAVFVASSNSAWWDVEPVITAISHFSLWLKTLHCWQKLSKSTNHRVYQVYQNALLLKIVTSVPAPLSPAPLYFSSHSLLRTDLHYLNGWSRLGIHYSTWSKHVGNWCDRRREKPTLPVFFFVNEHNNTNTKPQAKKQRFLKSSQKRNTS